MDASQKILALKDAIDVLEGHVEKDTLFARIFASKNNKIPMRVMQFWDNNQPDQIKLLLHNNISHCENNNIDHAFYDVNRARIFLNNNFDDAINQAFEVSPHPAMKADIFRLGEIAINGGVYLDADIAMRDNFYKIFRLSGNNIS